MGSSTASVLFQALPSEMQLMSTTAISGVALSSITRKEHREA